MRREVVSWGCMFALALFLAFPGIPQAQEIELKEGMTQGDFALWLVKAINAQSAFLPAGKHTGTSPSVNLLLNPAAGPVEAIQFLTEQIGISPEGGWQEDEPMTKEILAQLLEDPEEGASLDWDTLVEKVRDRIQQLFDKRRLGTFRVLSATPSLPAV